MTEKEQFEIAKRELAEGKGTKTDACKREIHLTPASVYTYLSTMDGAFEVLGMEYILTEYFMLLEMVQNGEDIQTRAKHFKLALASLDPDVCLAMSDDFASGIAVLLNKELEVLEYGKYKYSADNWRKVAPSIRYFDACGRHILHMATNGVNCLDEESGLPALYHAHCDISFFLELSESHDPYAGYDEWVEREKKARGLP